LAGYTTDMLESGFRKRQLHELTHFSFVLALLLAR